MVLGGHLERLVLLGLQLLDLELHLAHPPAHLAQVRVLLIRRLTDRGDGGLLERGERVRLVGGGELLEQLLARLVQQLGDRGAHLVLDGGARLGAEVAGEHARDVPAVRPERLLELLAQLGGHGLGGRAQLQFDLLGRVLEVLPQDLHAGAGLLTVEHAGADLDRVRDHASGIVPRVDPRTHQVGCRRIVDDDVLDDQPAQQGGDAGMAQGCGRGFHGPRTLGLHPDGSAPRTNCNCGVEGGGIGRPMDRVRSCSG